MRLTPAEARDLHALLSGLFVEDARHGTNPYLAEHGQDAAVRQHVNTFCWYARHLPDAGAFLDWGCHYGPDACLLRRTFGDAVDLHACDFFPESSFPAFRGFARARYEQLKETARLPYGDNTFDAVIGAGVLEHTAMDYEALKEVYRVLRPDGVVVITHLPYYLSWSEWYRRRVRRADFHWRLYGRGELSQLLKRTGFRPVDMRFHTFIPNVLGAGLLTTLKAALSRLLSPPWRHSTLCCVARKVAMM